MLSRRAIAEELMDADDLPEATYAAVMRDLARVNTVTRARAPTLAFLGRVAQRHSGPLRILDIGFGDGDMLRAMHRWAKCAHVDASLVGVDLNPRSLAAARASTPADMRIQFGIGDYAALTGEHWDVIVSSLVAHHMTHDQLVAFLRFMNTNARRGWFINDLHRHGFAWLGYPLLARIAAWHPIVRHDGQLSIARSYRPDEWPPILREAGIADARVFRAFPFRLCVEKLR